MSGGYSSGYSDGFDTGDAVVENVHSREVTTGPPMRGAPWRVFPAEAGTLGRAAPPLGVAQFTGFETGDTSEAGSVSGTPTVQAGTARMGGWALRCNPAGSAVGSMTVLVPAPDGTLTSTTLIDTAYVRFYFLYATGPAVASDEICQINSLSNLVKMTVRLTSAGVLQVFSQTGANSLGVGTTYLQPNQWHRVEVKCGTGSAAAWELKLNGSAELSGTGDLRATGTLGVTMGKRTNRNSNSVDFFYDDMMVRDDQYPGAGHCVALRPLSSDSSAWSAGAGSGTHAQLVGEAPNNGDVDYLLSTLVVGDAETFLLEQTTLYQISGAVQAVKAQATVKRNAVGASASVRVRSGTTNYDTSAGVTPVASYQARQIVKGNNPATGANWTTAEVNALEVGLVEQSAAGATRLTAISLMVDAASAQNPPRPEVVPPEVYKGPFMRGAPFARWLTLEASSLRVDPFPPPPPLSREITSGPPMRGAPWAVRVGPFEASSLLGTVILPGNPGGAAVRSSALPFLPRVLHRDLKNDARRFERFTEKLSTLVNSLIARGMLVQTGTDDWEVRSGSVTDTRAPTSADDVTLGYVVGMAWVNTTTGALYFCTSNARGAAVWRGPV